MENVSARGARSHLLIADDHAMFAETLRVYLEKTFTVVGVVGDGPAIGKGRDATPTGCDCCRR
jgi:DNA-binding NarL/FixJ family response regulator